MWTSRPSQLRRRRRRRRSRRRERRRSACWGPPPLSVVAAISARCCGRRWAVWSWRTRRTKTTTRTHTVCTRPLPSRADRALTQAWGPGLAPRTASRGGSGTSTTVRWRYPSLSSRRRPPPPKLQPGGHRPPRPAPSRRLTRLDPPRTARVPVGLRIPPPPPTAPSPPPTAPSPRTARRRSVPLSRRICMASTRSTKRYVHSPQSARCATSVCILLR